MTIYLSEWSLTEYRILSRVARGATRDLIEDADIGELAPCMSATLPFMPMERLTFEISLVCHFRWAVESSSILSPDSTFALNEALSLPLSRPIMGDNGDNNGGDLSCITGEAVGGGSVEYLYIMADKRSLISER